MLKRLLAAFNVGLGNRNRKLIDVLAIDLSGVTGLIDAQVTARHGSFHHGPGGTLIGEEVAGRQRLVARFVLHILAAGGECSRRPALPRQPRVCASNLFLNFSHLFRVSCSRNALVLAMSNFGSGRLNAQEKSVDGSASAKLSHVEHRMIRHAAACSAPACRSRNSTRPVAPCIQT